MKKNKKSKANKKQKEKNLFYPGFIFFFVLTVSYICIEFLFNATLIDNAGRDSIDSATLDFLEIFGRSVSAIGFTLLCLNLIKTGNIRILQALSIIVTGTLIFVFIYLPLKHQIWLLIIVLMGIVVLAPTFLGKITQPNLPKTLIVFCLFAWLLMYFGQKLTIDRFFIDNSSAHQRLTAQKMLLLKSGLANNIIKIKGLPSTSKNAESPSEKAFLIMIGLLTMPSTNIVDKIQGQEQQIIKKIRYDLSVSAFEKSWKLYFTVQQELFRLYKSYESASIEYESHQINTENKADNAWISVLNEVRLDWNRYLQQKYYTLMQIKALQFKLPELIHRRNACIRNSTPLCISSLDTEYNNLMLSMFNQPVKLTNWCKNESTNNAICTSTIDELEQNIESFHIKNFEDKRNSIEIETFVEFFEHPATVEYAKTYIHREFSIAMGKDWKLFDDESFKRKFAADQYNKLDTEWNEKWKKLLGAALRPKLDYIDFQRTTTIAHYLQRNPKTFNASDFSYTKKQFYETEIVPVIEAEINESLKSLQEGHLLANGMNHEDLGKQYMRMVIIPPIAASLSLLFALINSVLLIFSVIERFGIKKIILHFVKPVMLFSKTINNKVIYNFTSCLIVIAIIYGLKFTFSNEFSDSETFNYFVDQARLEGGIVSIMSDWVIHVQPGLYFIGDTLKSLFYVFWNSSYAYIIKGPLFVFDVLFLIIDQLVIEILASSVSK